MDEGTWAQAIHYDFQFGLLGPSARAQSKIVASHNVYLTVLEFLTLIYFVCLYVCVHKRIFVEVKEQFVRNGSLLPPCSF